MMEAGKYSREELEVLADHLGIPKDAPRDNRLIYLEMVGRAVDAESKLDASRAEVERLREALVELRICSRAKIGREDDFACADAQTHAALASTPSTL